MLDPADGCRVCELGRVDDSTIWGWGNDEGCDSLVLMGGMGNGIGTGTGIDIGTGKDELGEGVGTVGTGICTGTAWGVKTDADCALSANSC